MKSSLTNWTSEIIKRTKANKRRKKIAVFLAFAVTAATVYALLIPAFTLESKPTVIDCAAAIHEHTSECYDDNGELICGYADYVVHTHSESCYNADGELLCSLPEIAEHVHDDSCYTETKTLVCGKEENENHTHSDSCYMTERFLSCGKLELHTHTEDCYDDNGNLICGKLELKEHNHSSECFKTESSTESETTQSSTVTRAKALLKAASAASNQTVEQINGGTVTFESTETITFTEASVGTYQFSFSKDIPNLKVTITYTDKNISNVSYTGGNNNNTVSGLAINGKMCTFTINSVKKNKMNTIAITFAESSESSVQESSSSTEEQTTLTKQQSDYAVTVKGNKNKLNGCEVIVEKYAPESHTDYYSAMVNDIDSSLSTDVSKKDEIFKFVNMYHIYLSKDGGQTEYVLDENENINLQVTITDSSLSADSVYVGHYGNGAVKKSISDTDESTGLGVKQLKVKDNSITFHLKSFSVISAVALAGGTTTTTTDANGAKIVKTTGTLTAHDIEGYSNNDKWQIGTVGYYETINGSRMIKYIEPTDTEDVFKVTVRIEREPSTEDMQEVLQAAGGIVLQSNKFGQAVGTIVTDYSPQSKDTVCSTVDRGTGWMTFTYKTSKGDFTVKVYGNTNTNGGTYQEVIVPMPDGNYLVGSHTHISFSKNSQNVQVLSQTIDLTVNNLEKKFFESITPTFKSLTDTINTERFEYLSDKGITSTLGTTIYSNNIITWSGVSELEADSNAQMSYYVRLKTSELQSGANSSIGSMLYSGTTPSGGTSYTVGTAQSSVEGTYTIYTEAAQGSSITSGRRQVTYNKTLEADKPSAKGLLYYIKVKKQDKNDDTPLSGAVFTISGTDGAGESIKTTITTGEDGTGINSVGLPWGNYTVTETSPPPGYKLASYSESVKVAYQGGGQDVQAIGDNKAGKDLTGSPCKNDPIIINVTKLDADDNDKPMKNITLTLTGSKAYGVTTDENGSGSWTAIPAGTYTLTESGAPEGYQELGNATVVISPDGTVTVSGNSNVTRVGTSITVKNRKIKSSITLVKIGDGDTNSTLKGAEFKITSTADGFTPIDKATSDEDGLIRKLESVADGTYTITETKASPGYNLLTESVNIVVEQGKIKTKTVKINGNDKTVLEGNESVLVDESTTTDGVTKYTVYISNKSGKVLPNTGGTGTTICIIGGVTIIALTLLWRYFIGKKQKRRYE